MIHIPAFVYMFKGNKNRLSKGYLSPMFNVAQFTIAKMWKHKSPSVDKWIKEYDILIHSKTVFNHKKEENPSLYENVVGP